MNMCKAAVFIVNGLHTRFLLSTSASPRLTMPLIEGPLIQFVVEDVVKACIGTVPVFITEHSKNSIEDHFDKLSAGKKASGRGQTAVVRLA